MIDLVFRQNGLELLAGKIGEASAISVGPRGGHGYSDRRTLFGCARPTRSVGRCPHAVSTPARARSRGGDRGQKAERRRAQAAYHRPKARASDFGLTGMRIAKRGSRRLDPCNAWQAPHLGTALKSATANREIHVAELCAELKISRATLYRYVSARQALDGHGRGVLSAISKSTFALSAAGGYAGVFCSRLSPRAPLCRVRPRGSLITYRRAQNPRSGSMRQRAMARSAA